VRVSPTGIWLRSSFAETANGAGDLRAEKFVWDSGDSFKRAVTRCMQSSSLALESRRLLRALRRADKFVDFSDTTIS
jgi:hypothetical protein